MKILLCSPTYQCVTHGPAKFAKLILRLPEIDKSVEVRILTEDISDPIPNKVYKYSRTYPRGIGIFWEYWDNFLLSKKLKQIRKEFPFDVVLFNNAVQGWWSSKTLAPSVLKIGLINDDEYLRNSLSNFSISKDWFIKWKSRFLEKWAAHSLDHIISNSDYLKREIVNAYQLPIGDVSKMYKSIDLENFPERRNHTLNPSTQIQIFFLKNDFQRGGIYVLINALSKLKKYSFKLNFAGMSLNHSNEIKKVRVSNHVELNYLGMISQKEVLRQLHTNDILCIPSLREGLGVANIEGLSTKTPIVTSNAGGIPEVMDNGKNGWLAEKNNAEDLAKNIEACILNNSERLKKIETGSEFVKKNFSYHRMLATLLEIIDTAKKTKTQDA